MRDSAREVDFTRFYSTLPVANNNSIISHSEVAMCWPTSSAARQSPSGTSLGGSTRPF